MVCETDNNRAIAPAEQGRAGQGSTSAGSGALSVLRETLSPLPRHQNISSELDIKVTHTYFGRHSSDMEVVHRYLHVTGHSSEAISS